MVRSLSQWLRDWLLEDTQRKVGQIFDSITALNEVTGNLSHKIKHLSERIDGMSVANDMLVSKVSELKTVVDSAIALINGFLDRFKDVATMNEVQSVIADIELSKQSLAEAVAANTPVEPPVE